MSSSDWLRLLLPIVLGFVSGLIGAVVAFVGFSWRTAVTVTNWRRDVGELQEKVEATNDVVKMFDGELRRLILDFEKLKNSIPVR